MLSVAQINRMDRKAFVDAFGAVFEHSPWVADAAWEARPFVDAEALHRAMTAVVERAPLERRLALLRAHPELAGREAVAGALGAASSGEQGRLGFTALEPEEFARIGRINRAYRERFGFPCIVALRLHANRATVLQEMERRTLSDPETELRAALAQVGHIARGRLEQMLAEA